MPTDPAAAAVRRHRRAWAALAVALLVLSLHPACSRRDAGPDDRPAPATPPGGPTPGSAGGTPAATRDPGHQRMLAVLRDIARRTPDEHPYLGSRLSRVLKEQLAKLGPDGPALQRWRLELEIGKAELERGHETEALEHLQRAYALIDPAPAHTDLATRTRFRLAVGWMRHAETRNCCQMRSPEGCLLPIRGGGLHAWPDGSRHAMRYFREVLETTEPTSDFHLISRWLYSITAQTLGLYPDSIEAAYRVPESAFRSEVAFPRFRNVAPDLGLDTFSLSGGAIGEDFDNDGDLDIMVSTWDTMGPLRLFINEADGTWTERTREAGLDGLLGGLNLIQADYDNDGWVDVLVLRGAWLARYGQHPNSLLHNNGDGTFTDVSYAAGIAGADYPTQTADWADYDNDGDLDLYVGNECTREGDSDYYGGGPGSPSITAPCQLFRNNGDGTFTDVARAAGVENLRYTKAVVWGDYDNDGWPDLYVSNLKADNRLYRNQGDGTFRDVAPELGVTDPQTSFPAWFWDYNNDGALDILANSYTGRIGPIAAYALGRKPDVEPPALYEGDGAGGFRNVTRERGLERPILPMGSNFGDLDYDGWPDFYLGTGDPNFESLMPNLMFWNRGGQRFVDVSMAGGFAHLQKGHGIVFADLDEDGDQDVFEQMGGASPDDAFGDVLYENPGFGNHWLKVQLVGVRSNRCAIGARIRVDVEDSTGARRSVFHTVGTGGSFGANPLRAEIGLGRARRVARLQVDWPTTGARQVFEDVPLDRSLRIVEGERAWHVRDVPRRTWRTGGS